ncbi:hypothetical protein M3Y99_01068000 [Aphelenchoides fujianensis]|nr:hypothetical protein M3Y99_01068000 [Aphelenchoides fujianensis]
MEVGDVPKTTPKVTDYNTRVCLLYDYRAGMSAGDSVRKIHAIFGPDAVGLEGAKTWWKPLPQFGDESDEPWDAPGEEEEADKENAGGHSTTDDGDEEDEW